MKINASWGSQRPGSFRAIQNEFMQDKWAGTALVWMGGVLLCVYFLPLFMHTDVYERVDFFKIHLPPNAEHWLGTDYGGRDIFSLLVVGTRNSFSIAFLITLLILVLGVCLGMTAGYFKGRVDRVVMRTADFVASLPTLMIFIVLVSIIPKFSIFYFVSIIVLFGWVGMVRVIRAKTLAECELDYILASKTFGTPHWKILLLQLLPNLSSILIVSFTLGLAGNIGIESTLSFIGFGLPESTPSLGTLVSYAIKPEVIESKWWVWLPASLMIFTLMLAINFIGQAIKRATDAQQRTVTHP